MSGDNLAARLQEARRLLDAGDEAGLIAYLTERQRDEIASVLPGRPPDHTEAAPRDPDRCSYAEHAGRPCWEIPSRELLDWCEGCLYEETKRLLAEREALLEIAQAAQAATFALWESNDEERAAADALRAALARHQDTA